MSNFRNGQRLVCVTESGWCSHMGTGRYVDGPSRDEVVTFDGYCEDDAAWIYLSEYSVIASNGERGCYPAMFFRPLIEDLTAELARKAEDSLVHERPERVNEPQVA